MRAKYSCHVISVDQSEAASPVRAVVHKVPGVGDHLLALPQLEPDQTDLRAVEKIEPV